jgi:hypothetical protein
MKTYIRLLVIALAAAFSAQSVLAGPGPGFKEPKYKSSKPLYFRLVFGVDEKKQMLGVFDGSKGTGKGYDIVYLDYDADSDLKESRPIKFPEAPDWMKKRGMKLEPKFKFSGPFNRQTAQYTLYSYSFERPNSSKPANFSCSIEVGRWKYRFINGKLNLYRSADQAVKGKPYYIAGNITWDVKGATIRQQKMVSAAIKDKNGGTLRSTRKGDQNLAPRLTLFSGRKPVFKSKMGFG